MKAEISIYLGPFGELHGKVGCSLRVQTEANRFIVSLDLVTPSTDNTVDL